LQKFLWYINMFKVCLTNQDYHNWDVIKQYYKLNNLNSYRHKTALQSFKQF
jgi:hypothetical protein